MKQKILLSLEKLAVVLFDAPVSAPALDLTSKVSFFWRDSFLLSGIYHHNVRPFHHTNANWPSPAMNPTTFYHSCEKESSLIYQQ